MDYQISPNLTVKPLDKYFIESQPSPVKGDTLIVTSPSVENIQAVTKTIEYFRSADTIDVTEICHISPEVPIQELEQITSSHKAPDHIIAIGGGSVVDASKVLSVAWNGVSISDMFYKKAEMPTQKIQVTAVPTTAGTGAELSHGAIVFDRETSQKGGIRGSILQPEAVVIDSRLHKNAPARLIAETGFDCLTHAIETYCSKATNAIARYQSVRAVEVVLSNLNSAVQGNLNALERLAISASFMGINLAYSRTCLPHRIQYVIGPFTKTSHAQGLIMLYRGWLPLIAKKTAFKSLEKDLGKKNNELISDIQKLKSSLSIDYKLGDYGVEEDDVEKLTQQVGGSVELDPCFENSNTIKQIILDSI